MLQVLTSTYAHTLLSLLGQARSSVDILAYVVNFNLYKKSDKAHLIFLALKKISSAHLPVRFILDSPRIHKPNYHCNQFCTRRFKESGFLVRYLHSGSTQHAKLIIIDNRLVITGSHNLTTHSVVNKYDISLLIDTPEIVEYLRDYFDEVWSTSLAA